MLFTRCQVNIFVVKRLVSTFLHHKASSARKGRVLDEANTIQRTEENSYNHTPKYQYIAR